MNHTKLVSIIKTVVNEARIVRQQHHSQRYGYGKKLAGAQLHSPNKTPQLSETDKSVIDLGPTETGQKKGDKLILEPQYDSKIEPMRGPSVKQTLDTK